MKLQSRNRWPPLASVNKQVRYILRKGLFELYERDKNIF